VAGDQFAVGQDDDGVHLERVGQSRACGQHGDCRSSTATVDHRPPPESTTAAGIANAAPVPAKPATIAWSECQRRRARAVKRSCPATVTTADSTNIPAVAAEAGPGSAFPTASGSTRYT
jgi:hypothetical protein